MLRHFDGVVLELARRGHDIRIASSPNRHDVAPPAELAAHERISFVSAPAGRSDAWADRITQMRAFRDYLRYFDRRFNHAPKLRDRAIRKFTAQITDQERRHQVAFCARCDGRLVDGDIAQVVKQGLSKRGWKNLAAVLALMEDTIPSDPAIERFLRSEQPDVLVVTPLIRMASTQPEFVKSARALGIPSVFPVFSWDNLSSKGLVHVQPDAVLVWNDRQASEAVSMHAVPHDRITVTGAPRFDTFFAMRPQQSRADFCSAHGFDTSRPIVTYLGSSDFVSSRERDFVSRWIDEIRREPALAGSSILVRPHPREWKEWKSFAAPPGVALSRPQDMNGDQTLYDTVHHSAAVVGLNTSAELEAGIVGRPVFTILAPEFAQGQEGSLHFDYLVKEQGGFVEVAADFDAHRRQLARAVAGEFDAAAIRRVIGEFLRPRGVDRPATPIMADAIEAMMPVTPVEPASSAS